MHKKIPVDKFVSEVDAILRAKHAGKQVDVGERYAYAYADGDGVFVWCGEIEGWHPLVTAEAYGFSGAAFLWH